MHVERINRQIISGQVQTLEDLLEGEISSKGRCCQLLGSRWGGTRQVGLLSITEDHDILNVLEY